MKRIKTMKSVTLTCGLTTAELSEDSMHFQHKLVRESCTPIVRHPFKQCTVFCFGSFCCCSPDECCQPNEALHGFFFWGGGGLTLKAI